MKDSYEQRIQNQFGGFCVKVLKNEAGCIRREYARLRDREKSLDDLNASELELSATVDKYFMDEHVFEVLGLPVVVAGDLLAEAIAQLPRDKRDVILLSYFVGMNDREISERLNVVRHINNYKRSLKAAFYTAIEDDCIRKNPFNFKLSTVLEDDTEPKAALTKEQEDNLLSFMQGDKVYRKYYDVVILLGTGLRISEFCGLTTHLDFQNRLIDVDHQLLKDAEAGYYIEPPKTESGIRQMPMSETVYQALQRVLRNRGKAYSLVVKSNFTTDLLLLKAKSR